MSIEIIDGFKLNRGVPVDDRIVSSGLNARNSIYYKYDGLRVFDLSDQKSYVWVNNEWKKEDENSLIGTSLNANYLVKFNDINKGLTNSSVVDNGICVFINHSTLPTPGSNIKLDVNGVLKASSFTGIGANLTNLNASEINSGQLDYLLIDPPTTTPTQILITKKDSNNLSAYWEPLSAISGFSVDFKNIIYDDDSKFYILYTDGSKLHKTGDAESKILKYSPISGQILIKSEQYKPSYSSIESKTSGINLIDIGYIGFIIQSNYIIKLDNIGIKLPNGDINNPSLSYINDPGSGFYFDGSSISLSYQKKDRIKIFSDKILISEKLQFNNSSIEFIKSTPSSGTQYLMESHFKLNGNAVISIYDSGIELKTKSVNILVDTIYFYNINKSKSTSFTNQLGSNNISIFNIDNQNGSVVFKAKGDIKLMSNYNNKIYNYKISKSSPNLVSIGLTYSESSSINTLILNSNGQIISSSSKISLYTDDDKTLADIHAKSLLSNTLTAKSLRINGTQKISKILIDRISYVWNQLPILSKPSAGNPGPFPQLVSKFGSSFFDSQINFDSTSYLKGICRTLTFFLTPKDTSMDLNKYDFMIQPCNSIVLYTHTATIPMSPAPAPYNTETYNCIYNYITDASCDMVYNTNKIRITVNYYANYYPNLNSSHLENASPASLSGTKISDDKTKIIPGVVQTYFDLLLIEKVT